MDTVIEKGPTVIERQAPKPAGGQALAETHAAPAPAPSQLAQPMAGAPTVIETPRREVATKPGQATAVRA